ncbi:hypothetical protein [Metabacillus arenae]|uniref:Uncharacterized protein n=1 Tax=Metabacillus arenae TaxID=2771434 RepID=A0A926NJ11_9BACI|nr:hypothetical protein [Metabacillus arenae]MBD1381660.1 hypothetical protein [Metabacillus arenae]
MGRGKAFEAKKKGHEPTIPEHGRKTSSKHIEDVEYAIEPVAKEGGRPVSVKTEKE